MKKAMFSTKLGENKVKCGLCKHNCIIKENNYGICLARKNIKGVLYSEVYGKLSAVNVDPVEKKPLYHFYPGSKAFSIGTCGCNFKCGFCQNWQISQIKTVDYPYITEMTPSDVVREAKRYRCKSIAYTYNEPTINYEFALETSKLAHKQGIKNIFVTNGYIEEKPLRRIAPYLDAANIDLKSSNSSFYNKVCKADINKVLDSIILYHKLKIHIELTTLIVPGENDSEEDIRRLCKWVVDNLGFEVPLHFSRFFPDYLMRDKRETPLNIIDKAAVIAKGFGIKYVYGGNVAEEGLNNTFCPKCGELLVDRTKYPITVENVKKGRCENCNEKIPIKF
ncbi:MAG: AmmeMemoRadiSam system radical SAM enzyme [Nanoarchaeota archaeon]|nr:AmmeMemoRadiSam system radical SAM enzyme [Nanoarchaeota archaeon]